ncbi:MAG: hypothetical protein JHC95_14700 [Solirubrobacteraceae bacterium]|nr:hypothetical protein [Solirubrobacteraceae bacterium]
MRTTMNRAIAAQTTFDSARPTGMAVSAHRFEQAGRYDVALFRGDDPAGHLTLDVVVPDDFPNPVPRASRTGCCGGEGPPTAAVEIDIAPASALRPDPERALQAKGWLSLTGARPANAPHVVITPTGSDDAEFDSRRLHGDDVFGLTLLRPGTYAMRNDASGARGQIVVPFPKPSGSPFRPPAPFGVVARKDGFSLSRVELAPLQGLVFRFEVPSRILIELEEPDDGQRTTR